MFYRSLLNLLSPIILLMLVKQSTNAPQKARFIAQKLGWDYPKSNDAIWIHCASVGELKAAHSLIAHLLAKKETLLITVNTATAYQLSESLYGNQITRCYLPFDFLGSVRRFLHHMKPKRLLVLETEIWPHLYESCYKKSIRIDLLNGRLSKKSRQPNRLLRPAIEQALSKVNRVLVKDDGQIAAFQQLGVAEQSIKSLGNLKWSNVAHSPKASGKKSFVLLASSHSDEELLIANAWLSLNREEPLVIVPRHPKRGKSIVQQLQTLRGLEEGVELCTDSTVFNPCNASITVYARMNVLVDLFNHAKIVIMGGSFIGYGGHNIWEPASVGSVILSGPSYEDFKSEVTLLKQHQGIQICDRTSLKDCMKRLLDDPDLRHQLSEASHKVVSEQSNSLPRYLSELKL